MSAEGKLKEDEEPVHHFKSQFVGLENNPTEKTCLLCDLKFILPTNDKQFLQHLFEKHRLVIGDVEKISSLQSYIHYWRIRFMEAPLTSFCTTMVMNCTPDGEPSKNELYYLLSDCILEDKTLRYELHQTRLEWAIAQQSKERTDNKFKRGCLFCHMEISGTRSAYLNHLSEKHNVQLGKPENLVFIDKLLDKIEEKIRKLKCIYCEKDFKDRNVLKEHMRKKFHKRINPKDKTYDDFYITNYLEPGSTWRQRQNDNDETEDLTEFNSDNEDDDSWADWDEKKICVSCLLCSKTTDDFSKILEHMVHQHKFDFIESTKDFNFYEKIKIVNYIRRQIEEKKCIYCDDECEDVVDHMIAHNHQKIPQTKAWNQPEFFFPIEESDSFLYHLDTSSDDEDDEKKTNDNENDNISAVTEDNDEVAILSREMAYACLN